MQQDRLRDRIGSYHKATGPAQIYQPLPISPDYLPEHERFNKDFASHEREQRALKNE